MRRFISTASIVMALTLTVLTAPTGAAVPVTVGITDFAFTPLELTVPVGTTVTWINHDEETHTVTATRSGFGSTGLGLDDTFAWTFSRSGRYEYVCSLHPHMRAVVIVQ